jgi:hypothetical protein
VTAQTGTATCDPGDVATGGGFNGFAPNVETSRPVPVGPNGTVPIGWQVSLAPAVALPPGTPPNVDVYVVCADIA